VKYASVEEHPEFYDLFFVLGDGDFAVQRHKNNLRQDRPRGAICLTGSCIKPIFCIDTKPSNLVWIYQVITEVLLLDKYRRQAYPAIADKS